MHPAPWEHLLQPPLASSPLDFLWCWQVGRRHYLDLSWRGGAQRPVLSFILGTDSLLLLPAHSWRKKKVECGKLRSALRCPSLEGRFIARVSLISTTASFKTYWEEFAAEAGFIREKRVRLLQPRLVDWR